MFLHARGSSFPQLNQQDTFQKSSGLAWREIIDVLHLAKKHEALQPRRGDSRKEKLVNFPFRFAELFARRIGVGSKIIGRSPRNRAGWLDHTNAAVSIRSSYAHVHLSTLRRRPRGRLVMTRGRSDSLQLQRQKTHSQYVGGLSGVWTCDVNQQTFTTSRCKY